MSERREKVILRREIVLEMICRPDYFYLFLNRYVIELADFQHL